MIEFLKRHEDYNLFLLNNFENYGPQIGKAPYSGNFKLIYHQGEIIGVFCLTKNGILLFQAPSEEPIFERILDGCLEEKIPIKGLIGDWNISALFWEYLKEKKVIQKETSISKEVLYRTDLLKSGFTPHPNTRLLAESDYPIWKPMRLDFLKEKGIPNHLNENEMWESFREKVTKKIAWGLFVDGNLVSVADLTAKVLGMGQLGNVYTIPSMRRQGHSRAVMETILFDLKNLHNMHKLIIFTEENCLAPQKLYESLGAERIGYFAMLFGS